MSDTNDLRAGVERLARYETKVHARNRNVDYGIPVVVYAENRPAAVRRAIEIGWGGRAEDAQVTVLRVEQVPPAPPAGRERNGMSTDRTNAEEATPMSDPTTLVTDSAETLAEALGEHFVMWHELPAGGPPWEWRCQCGQKFDFSDSAIQHQAQTLITSGTVRPAAEAWADAERVWRWFQTDAAALRDQRDEARAALERVKAVRDDCRATTGARWIADALDAALSAAPQQDRSATA